jgi:hypothetical protein
MGAVRAMLIVKSMVLMTNQVSASPKRTYMGAGGVSCGIWLEARQRATRGNTDDMLAWVQGFLSGINMALYQSNPDFLVETDAQGISAWLDNYCRQHPLENLINASGTLISELTMRAAVDGSKTK